MKQKTAVVLVLALVASAVMAGQPPHKPEPDKPQPKPVQPAPPPPPAPRAEISMRQAQGIALGRTGGGKVVKVETDMKRHGIVYDFEIINERGKFEVEVDGANGNVRKFEHKPAPRPAPVVVRPAPVVVQPAPAVPPHGYGRPVPSMSRQQAEAFAIQQVGGGYVYEYELDTEHGRFVHEVEVIHNRRKYEIEIDDASGQMIKFKRD